MGCCVVKQMCTDCESPNLSGHDVCTTSNSNRFDALCRKASYIHILPCIVYVYWYY